MALILNIESSTSNCSVSLSKNGNLIHFIEKNDFGLDRIYISSLK